MRWLGSSGTDNALGDGLADWSAPRTYCMIETSMNTKSPIYALIGVWSRNGLTYFVRRSQNMENYAGVWSLFSERFDPSTYDPLEKDEVVAVFDRMSHRRLGGVDVTVGQMLSSRARYTTALGCRVSLWMYEVELANEPKLNPAFYSDSNWLTNDEIRKRVTAAPCGMCTRMLSDYRMRSGEISEPLVTLANEDEILSVKTETDR